MLAKRSCRCVAPAPVPCLWCCGQDVAWHRHHNDVFASVGDDRRLLLYVLMTTGFGGSASGARLCACGVTPVRRCRCGCGLRCDGCTRWDMRDSSGKPRGDFVAHDDGINCLSFNPFQVCSDPRPESATRQGGRLTLSRCQGTGSQGIVCRSAPPSSS